MIENTTAPMDPGDVEAELCEGDLIWWSGELELVLVAAW